MPTGFQVWGDGGFVQVDGDYMNLGLLISRGATSNTAAALGIPYAEYACTWVVHTTQNKNNLVALRCAYPAAAVRTIDNGTTYTYWIAIQGSPVGASINIYEFGQMSLMPSGSATGVEVYTPNGQVAFSSNYKYMRVVGWIDGSQAVALPAQYVYDGSKNYAVVLSTGAGYADSWFDGNADWENILWLLMANAIPGGIRLNEYGIWNRVQSNPLNGKAGYTFSALIIDVTGY